MILVALALVALAQEPVVASPLSPVLTPTLVDGPAVDDPGLLGWLEASGGRWLQLPVEVRFDDPEYPVAIGSARVGAVPLRLDDTAMSVALFDQLRALCPPGAGGCTVLVEGTWGPVVAMPAMAAFDVGPKRHDFAVRKLAGLAGADHTRARVAAP